MEKTICNLYEVQHVLVKKEKEIPCYHGISGSSSIGRLGIGVSGQKKSGCSCKASLIKFISKSSITINI